MPDLALIERSYCNCEKCRVGCRTMPGSLAPDDLPRIAEFLHQPLDQDFIQNHFQASDGAAVISNGRAVRVPTITPRQSVNGHCLFHTQDGRCSIHPVAPFGCRNFCSCGQGDSVADADEKSLAQMSAIANEPGKRYIANWEMLREAGIVAAPIVERRRKFDEELERLRERERERERRRDT